MRNKLLRVLAANKAKLIIAAAVLTCSGTLAHQAMAGYKNAGTVSVATDWASGSLGAARNSTDFYQLIGCHMDYGSTITGYCEARDSSNNTIGCDVIDSSLFEVVESLNGDSNLYFHVNTLTGRCDEIQVRNYSYEAPKVH